MIAGDAVLVFSAVYIVTAERGWRLGLADAIFWAAAATLLVARFLDIGWYRGTTASGEPATMAHWRRYAVLLLLVSVGLWAGAHFVSRLATP